MHLRILFTGSTEQGERLIAPFRALGPVTDTVTEMPYSAVGSIHAEPTIPVAFHARNRMLRTLGAGAVKTVLRYAGPDAAAPFLLELRHAGGALARPTERPSALGRRDGEFVLYVGGAAGPDEAPALQRRFAELFAAMEPWATGGVCVNFLSGPDVTAEELATGYLTEDVERLARIKRAYDPENLFRTHHGLA
jgi:hypothetical protein